MLTNNDLRLRVYLRSMILAMGFAELKRSVIDTIIDLEEELKTDPELQHPKKFDSTPKEILRRSKPTL